MLEFKSTDLLVAEWFWKEGGLENFKEFLRAKGIPFDSDMEEDLNIILPYPE